MKKVLSTFCLVAALAVGAMGLPTDQTQSQDQPSQSMKKSDGSIVSTTVAQDGTKTEVRTFETGDIARITRTTSSNGERMVMVEYRDGRTAQLEDKNDIEQAMDATADAIKMAADKTWNATKEAGKEVADKTEDVADKTVDVGKTAVDKTKEAGKEVADKTEDVADKTVDVGKKTGEVAVKGVKIAADKTKEAGKEVADKTEDVADKTVDVGKTAVDKTKEAGKEVADKTEDVADKTVSVSKDVAQEGVQKTKATGNWFKRGFKKVGGFFKNIFD
jgi:hypothetical protein